MIGLCSLINPFIAVNSCVACEVRNVDLELSSKLNFETLSLERANFVWHCFCMFKNWEIPTAKFADQRLNFRLCETINVLARLITVSVIHHDR